MTTRDHEPPPARVAAEDDSSCHGGTGRTGRKYRWRSVRGHLVPCQHGLHLVTRDQIVGWRGPVIGRPKLDGEVIAAGDKVVARRARVVRRLDTWNERTARLFAADCAERVLPIYEKHVPQRRPPPQGHRGGTGLCQWRD